MDKSIIINANPQETRVAILEDGDLVELLGERPSERRIVGDIYKGKVNAVLPGMQAAFVEIGLAKTAFLHASDLAAALGEDVDLFDDDGGGSGNGGGGRGRGGRRRHRSEAPKIEDHIKKGQEVIVQITKEPISTKGPRVTQQISLPGRYVVFMPGLDHLGVSRKIDDRDERHRLKKILREIKPPNTGLIVRTAGAEQSARDFREDVKYLTKVWKKIDRRASSMPSPALIHREMNLATGLIRDLLTEDVTEVVVDSKEAHAEILDYLKSVSPGLSERVKSYHGQLPIFDAYKIEAEIEKLFDRKVWLKRGGHLVIDQAEALVAIDINTGRFVGKKNQEETILKTNMDAAREVSRQLRLRDLGGIIVIDFIDMESESNRKQVLEELRRHLKRDRNRTKTFAVSELGLVEMTRQRERQSLLHYLSDDCPNCGGVGKLLSLESTALRIERILTRVGVNSKEREIELRVSPDMAQHLFSKNADRLQRMEKRFKFRLDIRDDPRLKRSSIKVIFPRTGEDVTDRFRP